LGGGHGRAESSDLVVLGKRRKGKLEAIVARPSSPQGPVRRARIVPLPHRRWSNGAIAAELVDTGISASPARRILSDLELVPHRPRLAEPPRR